MKNKPIAYRPKGLQRRRRFQCSMCWCDIWMYPGTLLRDKRGRVDQEALANLVCDKCAHERDHQKYSEPDCIFCTQKKNA